MSYLRVIGIFLANLFAVTVGTSVIVFEFHTASLPLTWAKKMLLDDCLRAIIAFGLGYFAYKRWKWASAKWIWAPGVLWFSQRAINLWYGQSVLSQVNGILLWEISGDSGRPDLESFVTWSGYTAVMVGTVFYSAGAWCCAHFGSSVEEQR